jgi:predicted amidohydrolase YtcJ
MSTLVITNGLIWDGIQKPFLGTMVCTDVVTSVSPGCPTAIPIDAEVLEAKGGSVIPAFTDVHQHFAFSVRRGTSKFVRFEAARSLAEAMNLLICRSAALKAGEWVVAIGFNHNQFTDHRPPTGADLDAVPNPVLIIHQCGHIYFVNSLAIAAVGASSFANMEGADRDSDGEMTGILEDEADAPLRPGMAKLCGDCTKDWVHAMRAARSHGSAQVNAIDADAVLTSEPVHVYKQMRDAGELSLRIRLYLTAWSDGVCVREDKWLSHRGQTIFIDGAFGSRTAALREPFRDVNRNDILRYTDEQLYEVIKKTFECALHLMTHVVGDRGLDQLLDALERLQSEAVHSDWPVKITHCELCHPDQVERIAPIEAFCDVQPG